MTSPVRPGRDRRAHPPARRMRGRPGARSSGPSCWPGSRIRSRPDRPRQVGQRRAPADAFVVVERQGSCAHRIGCVVIGGLAIAGHHAGLDERRLGRSPAFGGPAPDAEQPVRLEPAVGRIHRGPSEAGTGDRRPGRHVLGQPAKEDPPVDRARTTDEPATWQADLAARGASGGEVGPVEVERLLEDRRHAPAVPDHRRGRLGIRMIRPCLEHDHPPPQVLRQPRREHTGSRSPTGDDDVRRQDESPRWRRWVLAVSDTPVIGGSRSDGHRRRSVESNDTFRGR